MEDLRTEIRDRVRLEELIGHYVALRPAGRNFKGLCPFHADRNPSFTVNPERGLWRCWSCQAGGDVFDFVQRIENITFVEAMERLARQLGLPFQRRGEGRERASEREQLFDVYALATRFYREQLARSPEAQEYLRKRGLDDETLAAFGVGYAPPGWEALTAYLARQKTEMAVAQKASLVRAGERGLHDYFVDRILFPIRDSEGRTIAFGARALRAEQTPKYLNSPETPIFHKGRIWYGLDRARAAIAEAEEAVAVEGYMDVIALHQAGVTNAVAALGTAMTGDHVQVMRRYAPALVLAYDGDSAGINAALRNAPAFEEAGCTVRVAALPPGEDPDTLVRQGGAVAFRELVDRAEPLLEYRLRQLRGRFDLNDPQARLAMVREASQAIAQSRSHLLRQEYAGKLIDIVQQLLSVGGGAERSHDEQAALLGEIRRIALAAETARTRGQLGAFPRSASSNGAQGAAPASPRSPVSPPPATTGLRLAEACVLRAALSNPRWAAALAERLAAEDFGDPGYGRVAAALIGNNNDGGGASAAEVARDPAFSAEVSELLVDEESAVDEKELYDCLERIERHALKRRADQLSEEIARGTVSKTDQRYEEYRRLHRRLQKLEGQPGKGEG